MFKRKLLIVDRSEDFPITLAQYLENEYQVKYCMDGKEALALLHSFQPDILLTEIVVPGLDGISLLEAAASLESPPAVITFTTFYNDYMIFSLTKLNVSYWMIKPCDLHAVANRIRDLSSGTEVTFTPRKAPQDQVCELLLGLGFSKRHRGFHHLQEAILMEMEAPGRPVTKEIYPAIAKNFSTSDLTVEHAIRTAIQSAWEKRNDGLWGQYFPPNSSGTISRPTNSTAITQLAQALRQNS